MAAFYLPVWIGEADAPDSLKEPEALALAMSEAFTSELEIGVRIRVSREGYFVFDFRGHPAGQNREQYRPEVVLPARARFMNLFLACLMTELRHERKAVEHLFIDYSTIMAPQRDTLDPRYAASEYAMHQTVEHQRSLPLKTRHVIPIERIQAAAEATNAAAKAGEDRDLLAEMILHAFALHSSGQMEASLVAAWTVSERCLNELWSRYITEQGDRAVAVMNKKRRKGLEGIAYTASVITEILSLAGVLKHEDYERLTSVRRKRNAWVHKLETIDDADAASAIVLAQSMLRAADLLDLHVPFYPIKTYPLSWGEESD